VGTHNLCYLQLSSNKDIEFVLLSHQKFKITSIPDSAKGFYMNCMYK